ncbi:hypothetical protein ABMA28_013085 [Loxostege sticticalis]|uniref:TIL domain-containing protein n=1 Tax=Loxostege sticticalis TaxID=481309 RepID=A0ABD0S4K1_LOXSC
MRARTGFVFLLVVAFVAQALADCSDYANAESGCDPTCSRRCSPPATCHNKCDESSCRCKDGFLYNAKTVQCVEPKDC